MSWVAGLRNGVLYKVSKRPLDPTWSEANLQEALAWCATEMSSNGLDEDAAFNAAEALVMKTIHEGISWSSGTLLDITREQHEPK